MAEKQAGYPLAFMGESIKGIYAGTKTQTRRVCKAPVPAGAVRAIHGAGDVFTWTDKDYVPLGPSFRCPYGKHGELIWVREEFRVSSFYEKMTPAQLPQNDMLRVRYEADGGPMSNFGRKRECMFMPRFISRMTLELTGVRIERLQDVSDADCIAEGIDPVDVKDARRYKATNPDAPLRGGSPERYAYALMIERANGEGTWAANPFVWVLDFKPIPGNIDKIIAIRNKM